MNDAARKIVDRLKRFRQQDAVNLIESQAAEIERHREAALESTGLAGERIGTIAALRHEVTDQAAEIKRLRETYGNGCPCRHTTPCQPNCTCAKSMMSHGCRRCCRYGSKQQQVAMAEHLAEMHEAAQAADAKEHREA